MKNKLISLFVSLFISLNLHAAILEAKPVEELLETIGQTKFLFKEVGMVFGFNSIKSCMYVSDQMVVIKNYCVPKKKYPAKGYTIISPKFGMINFYQEQLSTEILKKDIEITTFPELLRQHLKPELSSATLAEMNQLIEKLYNEYGPTCWSTNFSRYTEQPLAQCSTDTVVGETDWKSETQKITLSEKNWSILVNKLETQFSD